MADVDAIVVGAGVWGCTLARCLVESGRKVLVVERRSAVGGNARCEIDPDTGIEVHLYGSHIFHTHDAEVWTFIRRFTEFNGYRHKVLARYRGKTYFLPIGLALINAFFGTDLSPDEVRPFMEREGNSRALFDAFFRGYTSKQWGRPPEEIDPSIIRRVPVRDSYDVNYFEDVWQGIPSRGYGEMFRRLLDHANIRVECGRDFVASDCACASCPVFHSGPIDRLMDYEYGALPWRSLRFEVERIGMRDFQGSSVVNYTERDVPYTRIHEFKHYHPEWREVMESRKTLVMREYPMDWKRGDEPYYPIVTPESSAMLSRYRELAAKRFPHVVFGGRLGEFRYLDMDQAIASALKLARQTTGGTDEQVR